MALLKQVLGTFGSASALEVTALFTVTLCLNFYLIFEMFVCKTNKQTLSHNFTVIADLFFVRRKFLRGSWCLNWEI